MSLRAADMPASAMSHSTISTIAVIISGPSKYFEVQDSDTYSQQTQHVPCASHQHCEPVTDVVNGNRCCIKFSRQTRAVGIHATSGLCQSAHVNFTRNERLRVRHTTRVENPYTAYTYDTRKTYETWVAQPYLYASANARALVYGVYTYTSILT